MSPPNKVQHTCPDPTHMMLASGHAEAHLRLKDWMAWFYTALHNAKGYGKAHLASFREFEKLSNKVQGLGKQSIIPYGEAVFNHTASQGYQWQIHYDPLFEGTVAYCQNFPPPHWDAPMDQYKKSPPQLYPHSHPLRKQTKLANCQIAHPTLSLALLWLPTKAREEWRKPLAPNTKTQCRAKPSPQPKARPQRNVQGPSLQRSWWTIQPMMKARVRIWVMEGWSMSSPSWWTRSW